MSFVGAIKLAEAAGRSFMIAAVIMIPAAPVVFAFFFGTNKNNS